MSPRADWKSRVLTVAYNHAVKVREKQGYVDMGRIQMQTGDRYLGFLAQAAALRGMKPSTYARRAIAAFVAADLGLPLAQIVSDTAHPRGYRYAPADDGLGYGDWLASPFVDDKDVVQGS